MVKSKSVDTKDYIMMQDELSEGADMTQLTDDQLDLWEMTLESLLDTLTAAVEHTSTIKEKLEYISRALVVIKSDVTTMIVTAKDNVRERTA